MKEEQLLDLGFAKEPLENFEDESGYYYYYGITGGLGFISCANDELNENGEWYVEIFNTEDSIRFTNAEDLKQVISLLEKARVKKDDE